MPAKKPVYKRRSDYSEASPVTVVRADGSRAEAPPFSPEEHDKVIRTRRGPARKTRWRDVATLPPLDERIAASQAEVAACRQVLEATQGSRDASATAEFNLKRAQAALAALLIEQGAA